MAELNRRDAARPERNDGEDETYLRGVRMVLQKMQNMTYGILAITLASCIGTLAAVRFLDLSMILQSALGLNLLVIGYANRRAVTQIPQFRSMLDDGRLRTLRMLLLTTAAADMVAFVVPVASGVRILLPALGA